MQRYFDAHTSGYDRQMSGTERWLLGRHREWATSRAAGDVLELAVGTGLNLPLYGERVLHVLGIDLSEAMPDRAQAGCTPAQHALTLLTVRCQADVDHLIPMTRSRTSRGRPGHRSATGRLTAGKFFWAQAHLCGTQRSAPAASMIFATSWTTSARKGAKSGRGGSGQPRSSLAPSSTSRSTVSCWCLVFVRLLGSTLIGIGRATNSRSATPRSV